MSLPNKFYAKLGPVGLPQNLHDMQLSPRAGEAIGLGRYVIANRSGVNADVGLFWRQPNAYWSAGIIDDSATPDFLGADSNAKSTTANAFVNVFTATNNDGFLVQSVAKFHALSFEVGDAAGGSPVFEYAYYNGSAFVATTPVAGASFGSTGKQEAIFIPPADWSVGTTNAVGSNSNMFAMRIRATTAPSDVCSISDVRVYTCIDFYPTLTDQNELVGDFGGSEEQLPVGASLATYYSGTANAANLVFIDYRMLSRQV